MVATPSPGGSPLAAALAAVREEARSVLRLALLIAALGVLMTLGFIYFRTQLYNLVLPTGSTATLVGLAAILVTWVVLTSCIQHIKDWLLAIIAGRLQRRLAVPACISAAEAGRPELGPAEALRDLAEVARALTGNVAASLMEMLLVPLFLLALAWVHWSYAVTAAGFALLAAGISFATDRNLVTILDESNRQRGRSMLAIAEAVNHAETVEAHGMLPALARGWASNVNGSERSLFRAQSVINLAQGINELLGYVVRGVMVLQSILLSYNGMELGFAVISATIMAAWVMRPFQYLGQLLHDLAAGRAAWQRLNELAALPHRAGESGFSAPVGRLVVEQLTVMLPGMVRPLLRDVSLVVGPGDVVGIAGTVGSGKSTLLRAVLGIQRPTSGGCYLDGHATWQWDRVEIARHVGYLPQDPGLTDGTVAEAIARLDVPNMALVIEAATRAGAHEAIVALPQGYATPLSETLLSAGQRQRVALARAIYGRPRLVVLDEPSAWLDQEGQRQLLRLFAILKADGCAVLFTSHSLDLVEAADHVLAMRGGMLGVRRPQDGPQPRLAGRVAAAEPAR